MRCLCQPSAEAWTTGEGLISGRNSLHPAVPTRPRHSESAGVSHEGLGKDRMMQSTHQSHTNSRDDPELSPLGRMEFRRYNEMACSTTYSMSTRPKTMFPVTVIMDAHHDPVHHQGRSLRSRVLSRRCAPPHLVGCLDRSKQPGFQQAPRSRRSLMHPALPGVRGWALLIIDSGWQGGDRDGNGLERRNGTSFVKPSVTMVYGRGRTKRRRSTIAVSRLLAGRELARP